MGIRIRNKLRLENSIVYTPLADGEYSTPIQFNPKKMYHFGSVYQTDDVTGDVMDYTQLADISTINNVNGAPTGLPANRGWGFVNWDAGLRNIYNRPYHYVTVDLEDLYNLDYCYVYYNEPSMLPFKVWGSRNGADFNELGSGEFTLSADWHKIEFTNNNFKGGIRYFKFGVIGEDKILNGIVLYGRRSRELLIQGNKAHRFVKDRPLPQTIGTNGFAFDDAAMMKTISDNSRFYMEWGWILGSTNENQGQGEELTPDDLWLELETSHMGNFDQLFQGYVNTGQHIMFTVVGHPLYLRNYFVQNARDTKPVDPGKNFLNTDDTTNPLCYTHMARLFYIIAARYGKNKDADISMIPTWGESMKAGLDLLYTIEIGNEYDGMWRGNGVYSPNEMAAYMSACYDGHKGEMGPGFGIKTADSSMLVAMPGLVNSTNLAYVMDMILWWDTYRGKGDYPMDIISIHHYNSTEDNQVVGQGSSGLQPEIGSLIRICEDWSNFRDTYCPQTEIWITETGYDEHLGSPISPNYPTWAQRTKYKAYWLIRTMIATKAKGLDVANQYWFTNVGMEASFERNMDEYDTSIFPTCQYMDALTEGSSFWGHTPLTSWWYMSQFKLELEGFYLSHFIMEDGVAKTNEAIINTADERVWAAAMHNPKTDEKMISIWLDSGNFASLSVTISVSESFCKRIVIDNAEIRQGERGEQSLIESTPSGSGRQISVVVNECPQLIFTSNTGTKKPLLVSNIKQQRLSTGENLIVWDDPNVDVYEAQVQRSLTENGIYNTIYTGFIRDASYLDKTAVTGTVYYYKINLIS